MAEFPAAWRVRAGDPARFTLRARDAYANPRQHGQHPDRWFVLAVPFPQWDALEPLGSYTSSSAGRASRDCIACSSVNGSVVDDHDGTYTATVRASRAGAYKVQVELLVPNGLAATYYNMASLDAQAIGLPAFQRAGQKLDSLADFASPCLLHMPPGLLPHQVPSSFDPATPHTQDTRCSGWRTGEAAGGARSSILIDSRSWSQGSVQVPPGPAAWRRCTAACAHAARLQ